MCQCSLLDLELVASASSAPPPVWPITPSDAQTLFSAAATRPPAAAAEPQVGCGSGGSTTPRPPSDTATKI